VLVEFSPDKAAYRACLLSRVLRQQLSDHCRPAAPRTVETNQLGFTHQKFQYYQGVRVEHACNSSVHAKGGASESISGDLRKSRLEHYAHVDESTALDRALASVGARKYMW
jgi:hypothetical protein